jgi:drug/metabolite transporter (DMT)-like permease
MVDPGTLRPALALMANAFVWGVSWWPFRELESQGLHPLWATAGIYALTVVVMLLWRPGVLRLCAGHPLLWLLAAVAGLTNVGFNWAVTIGDVLRVVLLFYLMPAWSVLLAWPLIGERPTAAGLLRLVLALAGVVVVLDAGTAGWPVPRSGADWLALMAGFCFAFTNVLLRKMDRVPAPARVMAMFAGGTVLAAATAGVGLAQGLIAAPQMQAGGLPVGLMLGVAFLLGNVALQYGAARLPAHTTALIMLSEVVFASVSSIALGAATLTLHTTLGGVLILAAAVWSAWPARRQPDARIADAQ